MPPEPGGLPAIAKPVLPSGLSWRLPTILKFLVLGCEDIDVVQKSLGKRQGVCCIFPAHRFIAEVRALVAKHSQRLCPVEQAALNLAVVSEFLERLKEGSLLRALLDAHAFQRATNHDCSSRVQLGVEACTGFDHLARYRRWDALSQRGNRRPQLLFIRVVRPYGLFPELRLSASQTTKEHKEAPGRWPGALWWSG
jgi:hypothetical protein